MSEEDFVGILEGLHIGDESDPPQSEPEVRRSPFGTNNHVWIEVNYDDLNLEGSELELFELYSDFSDILVDDLKKALVSHVWYEEDHFRLLKRHFQLMVWLDHSREWIRVAYDMSIQSA